MAFNIKLITPSGVWAWRAAWEDRHKLLVELLHFMKKPPQGTSLADGLAVCAQYRRQRDAEWDRRESEALAAILDDELQ